MSEYAYRQPVEVRIGADWLKAVYGYPEGGLHRVSFINTGTTSYWELAYAYRPDEIRPDPDFVLAPRDAAPQARSGWRLPEPGDVVAVRNDLHAGELTVSAVQWDNLLPILCRTDLGTSLRYNLWQIGPVHLHDAPAPTPEPIGTLDACRKQVIADNAALEAIAVQLEQDGHDAKAALARSLRRQWGES